MRARCRYWVVLAIRWVHLVRIRERACVKQADDIRSVGRGTFRCRVFLHAYREQIRQPSSSRLGCTTICATGLLAPLSLAMAHGCGNHGWAADAASIIAGGGIGGGPYISDTARFPFSAIDSRSEINRLRFRARACSGPLGLGISTPRIFSAPTGIRFIRNGQVCPDLLCNYSSKQRSYTYAGIDSPRAQELASTLR